MTKPKRCKTCEQLRNRAFRLEFILAELVFCVAHRGENNNKHVIHAGYITALERAFAALGWENPMMVGEARIVLGQLCRQMLSMEQNND